MSKENVNVTPLSHCTSQTWQLKTPWISLNFRAAKPFLDRKRTSDDTYSQRHYPHEYNDGIERELPASNTGIKRIALMEMPTNTPRFSTTGYKSINRQHGDFSSARSVAGAIDIGCMSGPFMTPIKQPAFSNLSDPFLTPSLLDEDFDESIFEEIDAICEHQSAAKAEEEEEDLNVKVNMERQQNDNINRNDRTATLLFTMNENVRAESAVDTRNYFGLKEEDLCTLGDKQSGNMPDEYSRYLQSLNDKQREAACSDISIPLMIVAGPGSGKTSTMVGRVLMLLNEGVSPSNILAMTFTTAAASEMRERICAVAGKARAKELTISTFHSFSLQLCRSHAEKIERTAEFLIYGHGQQRRAIIEAVRLLENEKSGQQHNSCKSSGIENSNGVRHFKDRSKKWQKFVIQAKASGRTPEDCRKMGDQIGAEVLGNYNDILRSCNALDYHDLIICSVKLLTEYDAVYKECQDSWKAIIVDEFQDTSATQYRLLRILASHNHITVVGDDDQSIFSFNGADISGFDSFRKDFTSYKEIRLVRNYRSTRCIVEAASCLIQNNTKRCPSKNFLSENAYGSKITIKECYNEDAQCAFVVDKILEIASNSTAGSSSYGNIAILYRRQVTGRVFQTTLRNRKIPFNLHGVAFYRKKVVRAIIAMLKTTLPTCDDSPYRKVFKALLPLEKEEKKRVIEHVEKITECRKCSFISAACDIFNAKISGTFKRSQLTQGRKVLQTLEMISRLVRREQSISAVITSVSNMIPQKYLLEQRAVIDVDGGKLLNEDNDVRSVLEYLLDDVSDFLSTQSTDRKEKIETGEEKGSVSLLNSFIDYITERERENFRSRRRDNENSVTLTTIHQSKGLEWDTVFIVKANETEIPLLHEFNGAATENGTSLEEERRLLYVAMSRARQKLFILYVTVDSNWQMLQPSRFLKEIPDHLREIQAEVTRNDLKTTHQVIAKGTERFSMDLPSKKQSIEADMVQNNFPDAQDGASKETIESVEACNGSNFLKRFGVEERSIISHLFHQWAKKQAFQEPRRLLDKVRFVIDERLRVKNYKHKEVLRELKPCLSTEEAFQYAEYIVKWEQIPADKRAHLMREKQERFQKLRMESSMGSSSATPKQEQSISAVITSVSNMIPQKYLLEQRAVIDVDGGKLLNEDNDVRSVLEYLLDDVSDFLSTQSTDRKEKIETGEEKGSVSLLNSFIDYITERERENFRSRRRDNENSVTLTTIHQSKGLEWDTVFIVKANETEIPLLHEFNGAATENGTSLEEERRLLYVAMSRARQKLFILYVTVDSNWQMLQPSRFLKEIPDHLREIQAEVTRNDLKTTHQVIAKGTERFSMDLPSKKQSIEADMVQNNFPDAQDGASKETIESVEACNGSNFLKRFGVEERSIISHLFHQWAKKQAFQEPRRLLDKVRFVIDERLRVKNYKHKEVLRELKPCLSTEEAFQYAEYIVKWEQIPADKRAHLMREKQERFQKLRMESSMGSSSATPKQIAYLQSLGCTVIPTSRLHASRLIEQYKSL